MSRRQDIYLLPVGEVSAETTAEQIAEALCRTGERVGIFQPCGSARRRTGLGVGGAPIDGRELARDEVSAHRRIVDSFSQCPADLDVLLIPAPRAEGPLGLLGPGPQLRLAADLGAAVVLVAAADTCRDGMAAVLEQATRDHATVVGAIAPHDFGVDLPTLIATPSPPRDVIRRLAGGAVDLAHAQFDQVLAPDSTLAEFLPQLDVHTAVLISAVDERSLLGIAVGCSRGTFPTPSATIVCTDQPVDPRLVQLWQGLLPGVPLFQWPAPRTTVLATLCMPAQQRVQHLPVTAGVLPDSDLGDRFVRSGILTASRTRLRTVTAAAFQRGLLEAAGQAGAHVVLGEGEEPRVLRAAGELLASQVVHITLLGDRDVISGTARELGVDIAAATIVDPRTDPLRDRFAHEFAQLRAHKGMTTDAAWELMADGAHFGTMMVHGGLADGMVSGAAHTTANTIRPALQVIRTEPGCSVISGSFVMCLPDRVLIFADCAVTPNPDADALCDIALSSARTARLLGLEPRVAMLSYASGDSAEGPDVDLVRRATGLIRAKDPTLAVDGPMQYDAAVVDTVARDKMPGSSVAGMATVLIFPDLAAGNIAYKAVQRSAGAVAIGPLLQGLRRPVNDLSRGSTVVDIVNTVAFTALQSVGQPGHASK